MRAPGSLLLTPLLTLLTLIPSIAATPVAQGANELIDPIPEPDFSRCVFPQIVFISFNGSFTLTALSETLPLQTWVVELNPPSARIIRFPRVNPRSTTPGRFTLKGGSLEIADSDGKLSPARFLESENPAFQYLFFGATKERSQFYWIRNCDPRGEQIAELKGERGMVFTFWFGCEGLSMAFPLRSDCCFLFSFLLFGWFYRSSSFGSFCSTYTLLMWVQFLHMSHHISRCKKKKEK
jgi:hypothetical protein